MRKMAKGEATIYWGKSIIVDELLRRIKNSMVANRSEGELFRGIFLAE